ncbi:MAG: hydrogenase iron-sulfur subunit [Candidatus Hydrothermarchaeaceae archaeon]
MEEVFEPNILTFCCNWCSYAAADLAGISRFQYPPNIRIVRVMCSGRIESVFILNAFKKGIDGVLVTGCHIGDCHYIDGNHTAEERMGLLITSLNKIGLEGRLRLDWISAGEGRKFAEVITEFTETIRELGPSPIRSIKNRGIQTDDD